MSLALHQGKLLRHFCRKNQDGYKKVYAVELFPVGKIKRPTASLVTPFVAFLAKSDGVYLSYGVLRSRRYPFCYQICGDLGKPRAEGRTSKPPLGVPTTERRRAQRSAKQVFS